MRANLTIRLFVMYCESMYELRSSRFDLLEMRFTCNRALHTTTLKNERIEFYFSANKMCMYLLKIIRSEMPGEFIGINNRSWMLLSIMKLDSPGGSSIFNYIHIGTGEKFILRGNGIHFNQGENIFIWIP